MGNPLKRNVFKNPVLKWGLIFGIVGFVVYKSGLLNLLKKEN